MNMLKLMIYVSAVSIVSCSLFLQVSDAAPQDRIPDNNLDERERGQVIPSGMKVIGVKVNADDQILGLLASGSTVDVLGVSDSSQPRRVKTVLRGTDVFSVSKPKGRFAVVGLLVNDQESSRLVRMNKEFGRIKLAIRDSEDGDPESESVEDEWLEEKEYVGALREMARELDETAARLEEMELYEEADRTRETAQSIRERVR